MSTDIQDTSGLYIECPDCHRRIYRGLQCCRHCGHPVSAKQQTALQLRFLRRLSVVVLVLIATLAAALDLFADG